MVDGFLEAWIHADHRVCGYLLQPYSASHVLALLAYKSPFAVGRQGDEGITARTVLLAAKICSQENPLRYRPKISFLDKVRYLRMRLFPLYFLEQVETLNRYIDDHLTLPETWERIEEEDEPFPEDKRARGPWLLNRIASLISQTSITLSEALRLPLGQLFWIDASLAEIRGEKVFADEEQFDGLADPVPEEVVAILEKERNARIKKAKRNGR